MEAALPGPPAAEPAAPRIAIIGAGIAGAALARAFRAEGLAATVVEAHGAGHGASGNPAALVTPRLDAGGGPPAQLHAQAFARAVTLYEDETPQAVIARGALQMQVQPRDQARFDTLAASDLFEPGALERLDAAEAGRRLGEPAAAGALVLRGALVVEPRPMLEAWLMGCARISAEAAALERAGGFWRVLDAGGTTICEAEVVCLAAGFEAGRLAPDLALQAVRGQASFTDWADAPMAAAWGGYVIPTRAGLLFGATHDRGQAAVDSRPGDDARNLEVLARMRPALAAALDGRTLSARAGVRASTPDRAPLAGEAAAGLFVLGGLGGRGFCLAPLLAEHIAARALGAPSPLPLHLAAHVDPKRLRAKLRDTIAGS